MNKKKHFLIHNASSVQIVHQIYKFSMRDIRTYYRLAFILLIAHIGRGTIAFKPFTHADIVHFLFNMHFTEEEELREQQIKCAQRE